MRNDLAVAFKNKTVYLVLFVPLFVLFSLAMVESDGTSPKPVSLGLLERAVYNPTVLQALKSAGGLFTLVQVADELDGKQRLADKTIDGLLMPETAAESGLILVVMQKESMRTLVIVQGLTALQKASEGRNAGWLSDIQPLHTGGIHKITLPTWILMLVLLVGFMVMPAHIAEEKEKKILLGLLQTPMREMEWLAAKVLTGMLLIMTAVLLLHLLGRLDVENIRSYAAFIGAGSFCFTAFGILLGFLCRNQASARTLGVVFYLPHLLPSALSDFSDKLTAVAPILPSYRFYEPVKSILLEQGTFAHLYPQWICLLIIGLLAAALTYVLIKKRWQM